MTHSAFGMKREPSIDIPKRDLAFVSKFLDFLVGGM